MEDEDEDMERVVCITCNETIEGETYYSRNSNPICEDCLNAHWAYCEQCDTNVRDMYYNVGLGICNICVNDNYYMCTDCGDYVHTDWTYNSEFDGEIRCESCYCEHVAEYENQAENIDGVRGYHSGAPWGLVFHHDTSDSDPNKRVYFASPSYSDEAGEGVYFGVELECENVTNDISLTLDDMESARIGHAEADGSLNNGIEFITQPATLNAWRGDFGLVIAGYMRDVRRYGGTFSEDTCGAHVHVSRTIFANDSHLARFVTFMRHNVKFVEDLSGRGYIQRWAKVNEYYAPDTMYREIKSKRGDRYRAVNLNNENTVEIRAFRGTDSFEDILGSIEFIAALAEYTRDITIPDINAGALLAESFATWLNDCDLSQYTSARDLVAARAA